MKRSEEAAATSSPTLWPSDRALPDGWSLSLFNIIASQVRRREVVEPDQIYPLIGMRWYAKGPYVKEEVLGANIKASHLYKVAKGDFIYNRLFAWKGSFGVVEDDCAHGYVSGEFPTFETQGSADAYYLWFLFSQPWVWSMLESRSAGATSTSRLRLNEDDLARFLIPLPLVDVRRQMVDTVLGKLSHVNAARMAAREQLEAIESLPLAIMRAAFQGVH
jgi:type I restriction enzyme, S subunit